MNQNNKEEPTGRQLVYLAAERTLLSWVRTAVGLMALGFVIDRFGLVLHNTALNIPAGTHSRATSFWIGNAIILLGVLMNLVAAGRYWHFVRQYREDLNTDPRPGLLMAIIMALVVAAAGLGILAFLVMMAK